MYSMIENVGYSTSTSTHN